jgi:hypothetical protein
MIDGHMIRTIRALLAQNCLSKRAIAEVCQVSRTVVDAVARGERMPSESRDATPDTLVEVGVPRRCPGCGGMTYMPCRACSVRAWTKRRRAAREFAA